MAWDELKRLQQERRRLDEVAREWDSPAALPGSRIHDVMQEHRRNLERRYREALARADVAIAPADDGER